MNLNFKPLTTSTWESLIELFGERGACGGCWCMWWRLRNKDYELSKGDENKRLLKSLVDNKNALGVIAFDGDKPIGWCSISPRESLIRLKTRGMFKQIDDTPVWSIICLYINKAYRKKGLSVQLIKEAVNYAIENGATCIEAYPFVPNKGKTPDLFAFVGVKSAFEKAGFVVVKEASETRVIMRREQ